MDIKKLNPWNWFKNEEHAISANVPVRRPDQPYVSPNYNPVAQFRREFDQMFDNVFSRYGFPSFPSFELLKPFEATSPTGWFRPNLDISTTDKAYTISVEVPGVDEKDVKLELAGNNLTIKGEKQQEKEEKNKNFYRMERSYGSFQRVLSLPEDADQDSIDAKFRNGVLTINLARKQVAEEPEAKQIEIKKAA